MQSAYDQQAAGFDARTLVHDQQLIVDAIARLVTATPVTTLIEIGCGTGQIGALLAQRFDRYVGIDLSLPMLQQYQPQIAAMTGQLLLQADGQCQWPVLDQQADVVFSSRAIHWLTIDHVVAQVRRIANPAGAWFVVGRIQRPEAGWESQLRRQCHQLLKQQQLKPRNGDGHLRKLITAFDPSTSQVLDPIVVSQWQQPRTIQQALDDWANKPGLAGVELPAELKQQILTRLKQWAEATFATHLPTQSVRQYVLYPLKLLAHHPVYLGQSASNL